MAFTNWLFNEGFYLHSRVTTNIFDSEAPFIFFHIFGWGEDNVHLLKITTSFIYAKIAQNFIVLFKQKEIKYCFFLRNYIGISAKT